MGVIEEFYGSYRDDRLPSGWAVTSLSLLYHYLITPLFLLKVSKSELAKLVKLIVNIVMY